MKHRYLTYNPIMDEGPGRVLELERIVKEEQGAECQQIQKSCLILNVAKITVYKSEHGLGINVCDPDVQSWLWFLGFFFLKTANV